MDIRDLKLGNMLLTENMTVKIADFGLACMIEGVRYFQNNCVYLALGGLGGLIYLVLLLAFSCHLSFREQIWFNLRHPELHRPGSAAQERSQHGVRGLFIFLSFENILNCKCL